MGNEVSTTEAESPITVSKPQINTALLQPGTAVVVKKYSSNRYVEVHANAIVTYSAPLKMGVLYMGKENGYSEIKQMQLDITIDQIERKLVEIKLIKAAI